MKNNLFKVGALLGISALILTSCTKEVNTGMDADLKEAAIGQAIKFSDTKDGEERNDVSISWDFGDGTSTEERNPSHVYHKAGVYSVTQTVRLNSNASKGHFVQKSEELKITILGPKADFTTTKTKIKIDEPLVIENKSEEQEKGFATTYLWSYSGNGMTEAFSTKKSPSIKFSNHGKYTITLTATQGLTTSSKSLEVEVENANVDPIEAKKALLMGNWFIDQATSGNDQAVVSNYNPAGGCTINGMSNGSAVDMTATRKLNIFDEGIAYEVSASSTNQTLGSQTIWQMSSDGKFLVMGTGTPAAININNQTAPFGVYSATLINNNTYRIVDVTATMLKLEQISYANAFFGTGNTCNGSLNLIRTITLKRQ
jgi:PKD repeat protein